MKRQAFHIALHKMLWLALALSLLVSLKVNAFILMLLFVNWLLEGRFVGKFKLRNNWLFFISVLAYFLVFVISSLLSEDIAANFKITERKTAFLLLPILGFSLPKPTKREFNIFTQVWSIGLSLSLVYCLIMALIRFNEGGTFLEFFYHNLGSPLNLHAVYYSALMLTGILFLEYLCEASFRIPFQLLFIGALLLLSSKLFLGLTFLLILIKAFKSLKKTAYKWSLTILLTSLALFGIKSKNPISSRFQDISFDRLVFVNQEKIGEDVYLDGLSLRLLQIRFGFEILNENRAWLFGVGQKEAQTLLDNKYQNAELYTSTEGKDRGFLGYNFHNQFLETLVQGGLIALIPLLSLFFSFLKKGINDKNLLLIAITAIYVLFSFTESVFERQLGIVSFLVFGLTSLGIDTRFASVNHQTKPRSYYEFTSQTNYYL